MIDWFRAWSKEIIVAVIISTVIEMILPNVTSKKYIKIIIGIFIVYTIIGPVINEFSQSDLPDVSKYEKALEVSSIPKSVDESVKSSDIYIKNIYVKSLEDDIKKKLETKGYITSYLSVKIYDDESYKIKSIELTIGEKKAVQEKQVKSIVDNIKDITIKIDKNSNQNSSVISSGDSENIKKMLKENYDVEPDYIYIS